jgi:hypothetical protein
MSKKALIISVILSALIWLFILFSISLFLFHWRTANEPGVQVNPGLLRASFIFFGTGAAGTITINSLFIKFREKKFWIAWVANIAVSIAYAPAMLLTLIMMS